MRTFGITPPFCCIDAKCDALCHSTFRPKIENMWGARGVNEKSMIFQAILKLWLVALVVVDASNTTKHFISTEDFNSLKFVNAPHSLPISFSSRIRRQQAAGVLSYVYNTDTDESSGKWSDWVSDKACSRTCGGGVLVETRECEDGSDCTGPSKRYSSCNTQECPPGTPDFRLEQCQKFNSVPFERKLYDWIPYLKAPRKCELNCMPRGERFYYRHEKMVSHSSTWNFP